ncbi:MAG: hypothetical protein M1819_004126 [Sarea resinae]|nr:MAG: hypothetical protein M1819_004126 [Sarea resinae]
MAAVRKQNDGNIFDSVTTHADINQTHERKNANSNSLAVGQENKSGNSNHDMDPVPRPQNGPESLSKPNSPPTGDRQEQHRDIKALETKSNGKGDQLTAERQPRTKKATIIRKTYRHPDNGDSERPCNCPPGKHESESRSKIENALQSYKKGDENAIYTMAEIAQKRGVPSDLRCLVWPILLNTHPLLSSVKETSAKGCARKEHSARDIPLKRIKAEIARYHRRKNNLPNTSHGSPLTSASPGAESTASASTVLTNDSSPLPPPPDAEALHKATLDAAVEDAVVDFLEKNEQVEYSPGMIYVCLTLSDWLIQSPTGSATSALPELVHDHSQTQWATLSKAFDQTMSMMLWAPSSSSCSETHATQYENILTRRISHFLSTFRRLLPELAAYFDEEEVSGFGEEWVHSWIQWWLSRELGRDEKGRLWDFYLGYRLLTRKAKPSSSSSSSSASSSSSDSGYGDDEAVPFVQQQQVDVSLPSSLAPPSATTTFPDPANPSATTTTTAEDDAIEPYSLADWHMYICLALLRAAKDALEELELSEIRALLGRLGLLKVDMDAIIREADRMRKEARELGAKEEEEACRRRVS